MDLRAFPPHEAGETLEAYLRRSIRHEDVSVSALAVHLDILRAAIYKIRDGGGVDEVTLARFGALTGLLDRNDRSVVYVLRMFDLLVSAEAGWAVRAWLLTDPGSPNYAAAEAAMSAARSVASAKKREPRPAKPVPKLRLVQDD